MLALLDPIRGEVRIGGNAYLVFVIAISVASRAVIGAIPKLSLATQIFQNDLKDV